MQKRHARWIAGFAVAGTVVFIGAAAGAAADVRTPQDVSPATCAALATDLAATLAQASKGLAATPPDLPGVTTLVAQANKLQDVFKTLDCTAVPIPAAPNGPTVPSVPSKPSAPVSGGVPSLPASPSLPALPSSPSMSTIPGLGNIPGLTTIPGGPPPLSAQ